MDDKQVQQYVDWFRRSAPYIHAHRGRTLVILFGGEAVDDAGFANLIHDIALLDSLGVRLVLVHGARPQIEVALDDWEQDSRYYGGLRITDEDSLPAVLNAVGSLRVRIEALLSMGLANSPMHGARLRVASGNFVTARPLGVRDGVDFAHTGEVRRVDAEGIRQRLDDGNIVLLSCLGYSPTGEVFNLSAEDVATAAAVALQADKLISLVEGPGLMDAKQQLIQQLTPVAAEKVLSSRRALPEDVQRQLVAAAHACRNGVGRAHLLSRHVDGALLQELFTRDGVGTMITSDRFEELRPAQIDDVNGILEIIAPLEDVGAMVRRSREQLELEIDGFTVIERDGMVVAVGALYPYAADKIGEIACVAVHPDYQKGGRGNDLLAALIADARDQGLKSVFVLTTHTAHWFQERGFQRATLASLPVAKQRLYNYQRNSKVFTLAL